MHPDIARAKAAADAAGGPEAYPYDPECDRLTQAQLDERIRRAVGLAKLRFIKFRSIAEVIYASYWANRAYQLSPGYQRDQEWHAEQRERAELEALYHRAVGGGEGATEGDKVAIREAVERSRVRPGSNLNDLRGMKRVIDALKADSYPPTPTDRRNPDP